MMKKNYSIVGACWKYNRGIGINNQLPWSLLKKDMQRFKDITSMRQAHKHEQNVVIMGRNTWDSIPEAYKPLKGRFNIVVSKTLPPTIQQDYAVCSDFDSAIHLSQELNDIFVIGGESLYKQALSKDECKSIYLTEVGNNKDNEPQCDVFFPKIPSYFHLTEKEDTIDGQEVPIRFLKYKDWRDTNSEEYGYLNTLKELLKNGQKRDDRTKIGTYSLFGKSLEFSLNGGVIPLLTTKRVWYK